MKIPPTWCVATTSRASAGPVTPTINSCASLSRGDICANSSPSSPQAGAAGGGTGPLGATRLAVLAAGDAVTAGAAEWRLRYRVNPAAAMVPTNTIARTMGMIGDR